MVFLTKEKVLEQFRAAHKDKYDYSKVVYVHGKEKVTIGCKKCGLWWEQTPAIHKKGKGCPVCNKKKPMCQKEVIRKFEETHKGAYDYSKVVYLGAKTKVTIGCKKCGNWFQQRVGTHRNGSGCKVCAKNRCDKEMAKPIKEVIAKFIEVHGNRYDYSKVDYVNRRSPITIGCRKCGKWFKKQPFRHTYGIGCSCYGLTKSEHLFGECLAEMGHKAEKHRPSWLVNPETGSVLELDYYLPKLKIAFEVQGAQHYKPIEYWGGEESFKKLQERDRHKRSICFMNGVALYEYDLRNGKSKKKMLEFLEKVLGSRTIRLEEMIGG